MSRCSACIYNRKIACPSDCVFRHYFPGHENIGKFATLDQVFHTKNLERMISSTHAEHMEELLRCLLYEATERLNNPVTGCTGVIERLQGEKATLQGKVARLRLQVEQLKAETVKRRKVKVEEGNVKAEDE